MRSSAKRKGKRGAGLDVEELNLLPLMSLFVALVPALLYSAVFTPVSAVGLDFPGTGGAASESPLALAVRITDDTFFVEGVPDSAYAPLPRLDDPAAALAGISGRRGPGPCRGAPHTRPQPCPFAHPRHHPAIPDMSSLIRDGRLARPTTQ